MAKGKNWIREELILAFNLYCKIPFGQYNQRNPKVIELAQIIGRTPSSVAFKLVNFASLDPYHKSRGVAGMQNISKLDREIYAEFSNNWDELIFESEILLAQKLPSENLIMEKLKDEIEFETKKGNEVTRLVKTRINQSFFRKMVLANYNFKCAVSEIDLPEILVASHIVPWSKNKKERLNPHNGICLSPLYDKMFDIGLMSLTENYTIIFAERILELPEKNIYDSFFLKYSNKKIHMPKKFLPDSEFLMFHRDNIFKG